jgi:hypothetical protein
VTLLPEEQQAKASQEPPPGCLLSTQSVLLYLLSVPRLIFLHFVLFFSLTFFFLWFELKASCLLGRHATILATPLALFCIGLFFFFFFEIGSPELFASGWLQTAIFLISASSVARIAGVSYQHQDFFNMFISLLEM